MNPLDPLTPGELLEGWQAHVSRIARELEAGEDDPYAWGAYDLVAALCLRDAVARGYVALSDGERAEMQIKLELADRDFMQITEVDRRGLVRAFDDQPLPRCAWWWDRVPLRGPIRRELGLPRPTDPEV